MFILDGKPLSPDVAFTDPATGVQYPANWLRLSTLEEKEAIGITEQADPPVWDQRFAWGYSEDGQLIWKDHTQLVEQWVAQTRITAGTLIQPTDWMVIREQDNGTVVPESVKALREDIRLATGQKNAAIEATADTAELAAYITGTEYPVWPSDSPAPVESVAIDGLELAFNGGATGGAII
jgi:hypothetical protein